MSLMSREKQIKPKWQVSSKSEQLLYKNTITQVLAWRMANTFTGDKINDTTVMEML